ncbi:MAG: ABC transporter permease [Clostridium sp.]|jgi:hypothetical protein|nr:ABC transporter permease [Clostridium sp.]
MKNILVIFKNNLLGIKKYLFLLLVMLISIPLIFLMGKTFSNENEELKKNIAVNCESESQEREVKEKLEDSKVYNLIFTNEVHKTDLINGKYLAEVGYEDGEAFIKSYRSNDDISYLNNLFFGSEISKSKNNTMVCKVIGFLCILIFMVSKLFMGNLLEERENGILSRILTGGVSFYEYSSSQMLFNFLVIFIPCVVLSIISIFVLEIKTINFGYFLLLLMFVCLTASSFAFCVFNCFKKKVTVEFVSSMVILLTSIFGGCIIDTYDDNKVISFIRTLIPQKILINLGDVFEVKKIILLIIINVVFIFVGMSVGKSNCDKGIYI